MDTANEFLEIYYRKDGMVDSRDDADSAALIVKKPNPFKPFERGMEQRFTFKRLKGKEPWRELDAAVELFEIGFSRGATEKMREIRSTLMLGEDE